MAKAYSSDATLADTLAGKTGITPLCSYRA